MVRKNWVRSQGWFRRDWVSSEGWVTGRAELGVQLLFKSALINTVIDTAGKYSNKS